MRFPVPRNHPSDRDTLIAATILESLLTSDGAPEFARNKRAEIARHHNEQLQRRLDTPKRKIGYVLYSGYPNL